MNCDFCNNPCEEITIQLGKGNVSYWSCNHCPLPVCFHRLSSEIYYIEIYFTYKEQTYKYIAARGLQETYLIRTGAYYYVNIKDPNQRTNLPVLLVPLSTKITPDNVVSKFKMYLTFS